MRQPSGTVAARPFLLFCEGPGRKSHRDDGSWLHALRPRVAWAAWRVAVSTGDVQAVLPGLLKSSGHSLGLKVLVPIEAGKPARFSHSPSEGFPRIGSFCVFSQPMGRDLCARAGIWPENGRHGSCSNRGQTTV